MEAALDQRDTLAGLRAAVLRVVAPVSPPEAVLRFGVPALDDSLFAGGLVRHALHEVSPASSTLTDDAAATLFVAGIAARLFGSDGGPVLWAATRFDLYAPGLEQAGLSADRVLFAEGRDDAQVLALVEDGLRHGGPAAVVGEVHKASRVATRRLQLAAADSGTPVLLLRRWRRRGECPLAEPSSAATRWRVGSAPSSPLHIPGVGRARWSIELVRQRNGTPLSLMLQACDDQGRLAPSVPTPDRAPAQARASSRAA